MPEGKARELPPRSSRRKRELLVLLPQTTRVQGDWCVVELPLAYTEREARVKQGQDLGNQG